jgi:hypothetical protein
MRGVCGLQTAVSKANCFANGAKLTDEFASTEVDRVHDGARKAFFFARGCRSGAAFSSSEPSKEIFFAKTQAKRGQRTFPFETRRYLRLRDGTVL